MSTPANHINSRSHTGSRAHCALRARCAQFFGLIGGPAWVTSVDGFAAPSHHFVVRGPCARPGRGPLYLCRLFTRWVYDVCGSPRVGRPECDTLEGQRRPAKRAARLGDSVTQRLRSASWAFGPPPNWCRSLAAARDPIVGFLTRALRQQSEQLRCTVVAALLFPHTS